MNTVMHMSALGRKLLTQREGKRLKAYRDSVGVLTIGVGHTAAAGRPVPVTGMTITDGECDEILSRDLVQYERAIGDALNITVAQHEFDALVSVCFNVGPKFATSTCIKRLNAGNRKTAAEAIMMWDKPPEIIGRRRSEQKQFLNGYGRTAEHTTATIVAAAGGAGTVQVAQSKDVSAGQVAAIGLIVALVALGAWLAVRKWRRG